MGQPTTVTDAATKGYIDKTLAESHLLSSHKSNEFKYLDDPNETSSEYNITIDAFTDFNDHLIKIKKHFKLLLQRMLGLMIIVREWGSIYTLCLWVHIQ